MTFFSRDSFRSRTKLNLELNRFNGSSLKKTTWGLAIALGVLAAPEMAWADAEMHHSHDDAPTSESATESHDSMNMPPEEMSHGGDHHHMPMEVPEGQPVPSVQLSVLDDPVNGWNLVLDIENFQFAPEQVNQSSSASEGHAHLYINGEKIMRIYSSWHHLPSLEPGTNEVMVTLNANGHEALTHNGEAIADTVVVSVPE